MISLTPSFNETPGLVLSDTENIACDVCDQVRKDGSMNVMWIDKYSVGANISTKAVGSSDRHDLTGDYKYPDGNIHTLLSLAKNVWLMMF